MKRRLTLGLITLVLLGGLIAFVVWYPIGPLDRFRPSITVSKQTTMATGAGIPDHDAASKQAGAQPPTILDDREGRLAGLLIGQMFPAVEPLARTESQLHQQLDLLKLGFALAAYRTRHGSFPASLAALSPDYQPEIPRDIFAEDDLIYRPTDSGFVLYCVGPDFNDDGGVLREGAMDQDYDLVLEFQR